MKISAVLSIRRSSEASALVIDAHGFESTGRASDLYFAARHPNVRLGSPPEHYHVQLVSTAVESLLSEKKE